MTIPADSASDDSASNAGTNTALAALPESSGVDPFTPKPEDAAAPRGLRARLLDYSAHAAMIVGLIGFAWTVGDHVVHRNPADMPAKTAVAQPAANDPVAELRSRNGELADTVRSLQARLDALQTSLGDQAKVAAQVRVLQAGLDNVKSSLGTARSEQAAVVARLDGKIDKLGHEPGSKMQQLVDRLGKLEHSSIDVAPTASLPRPDARSGDKIAADKAAEPRLAETARPMPRPADLKVDGKGVDAKLAGADDSAKDFAKPQVIANWVVRDVYQGVALIEGRRGTLEVVPGVSIPGAGVVKSIDRHGSGWTVTTTKGLVAYGAPARDYRRADRGGYYPGQSYRYDF